MHRDAWVKVIQYPVFFILFGAGLGILVLYFAELSSLPLAIRTGFERIVVPLDQFFSGVDYLYLNTQNLLLLEQYVSEAPLSFPVATQLLGLLFWVLLLVGVWLLTFLKRNTFLVGAGLLILLLTVSGVNGLNIGSVGSKWGLILVLLFLLLPAALIHFFGESMAAGRRAIVTVGLGAICLGVLIYFSAVPNPTLLFSENGTLMALVIAGGFLVYTGNVFLTGVYLFLARLNTGVGIKIAWHFGVISSLYLLLMGLMLLDLTGSLNDWALPPFQLVLLVVGAVGYPVVLHKIRNSPQLFGPPWVGKLYYLIGFSICLLVLFKGMATANTPMIDFLNHLFVYSQLGFGLLFFLYVWVNFSGIINSGKEIDKIVYKPPFFPFFHLRLGGAMSLLIFLVYADGIIAVQFSTASTQLSADYYYASKRPVEATALYENAFEQYRRNDKALLAAAHLYLEQNQPTLALNTMVRSFEENPRVVDIVLLGQLLEKRERTNDAIFYLEQGLRRYPGNPYLSTNLALIYHRINRPQDALAVLRAMEGGGPVQALNLLALEIKENQLDGIDDFSTYSLKQQINLLASFNMRGIPAPERVSLDTLTQAGNLVNRALLRNQLTAGIVAGSEEEIRDRIEGLQEGESLTLSEEESIRESRLLLEFRAGAINELVKRLNGMAFRFSGNAGYYHAFAGWVLSREGDFEKAAIEWKQAALKGYAQFTSAHLPFLYFGGMEEEARFIAGTQQLAFPEWMAFDSEGKLLPNETVTFFRLRAELPKMLGAELMPAMEKLENEVFRQYLAREILLRKGHWLNELDRAALLAVAGESQFLSEEEKSFLADYVKNILGDSQPESQQWQAVSSANAYLTPLVLAGLDSLTDEEDRYRHLQEASQFNKDPKLWIELVRYCRIIGLDQYASSNLAIMAGWIGQEELTRLQLEHL
ncbi:tetratricopeptide repeat protein [Cyclobacterium xiamenense]|uniref:tetratricopeptide repeat protein n=1 Tax=Cyclobacterium xiamenense TaxID=1297121 RepID=UPI0012B75950|nr:tetratricopeptide repeat protein [Cyclobacterium xiamenense]